ncbi:glycosyltransferase family 2 protein [Pseudomonas sp. NPDC089734]|uniref:glycosyltransferase family 2 protein n=1 Tax=Pseudomonas sp. NPDC089734 TaxID=3364469 RepID=UPI00381993B4
MTPPATLNASEAISEAVAIFEKHPAPAEGCAQVAILLCTFNGQRFLSQQLASIKNQRWPTWFIALSDDGSSDNTLNIAGHYQALWGHDRMNIWRGPGLGFAQNFISCIRNRNLKAEFYAWCDQDDIWHEDKLQTAITWLQSVPANEPALYLGRTELIGEQGDVIGYSPLFRQPPSFANALVQNIGGGNTMVFNHAARCMIQDAAEHLALMSLDIVSHDWWAYLLITGVGGHVHYDPTPYVSYRQHDSNLVGSNAGWQARALRIRLLLQGRFRDWNTTNIAALEAVSLYLTDESRDLLKQLKALRAPSLVMRLVSFRRTSLYRQTRLGNLGLLMAVLVNVM